MWMSEAPCLIGVEDEVVDEPDDGAFAGGLRQVGDFVFFLGDDFEFLVTHVLHDFVELFAFLGVGGVAGLDGGVDLPWQTTTTLMALLLMRRRSSSSRKTSVGSTIPIVRRPCSRWSRSSRASS